MSASLTLAGALGREVFATTGDTLVHALFKVAPARRGAEAMPLNVVALVERGAAMEADRRLEWAGRSLLLLAERLGPEDQLGLVAYGDRAKVLLSAEPLADPAKARRQISFLDSHALGAGASLLDGLKAAHEELMRHAERHRVNRLVLLTAAPLRQEAEVERLARVMAAEGLRLSVFGLGSAWSVGAATRMADASHGSVHLVPRPQDLPAVLAGELAHWQRLPYTGLQLRLRLAKGVTPRRVFQVFPAIAHWLPQQPGERDVLIPLGEVAEDQPCYVLVELVVAPRAQGAFRLSQAELVYEVARPAPRLERSEPVDLVATVAEANGPLNREVLRYVEQVQLYSLVERGIEARRGGDAARAGQLLASAGRIAAGGHEAVAEVLEEATAVLETTGALPEVVSKRLFFAARQPEWR